MLAGERWLIGGPAVKKKKCSLTLVSVAPLLKHLSSFSSMFIHTHPTTPNLEQDLRTQQRFHGGTKDGGGEEKSRGGERKRKGNLCSVGINKALSN